MLEEENLMSLMRRDNTLTDGDIGRREELHKVSQRIMTAFDNTRIDTMENKNRQTDGRLLNINN